PFALLTSDCGIEETSAISLPDALLVSDGRDGRPRARGRPSVLSCGRPGSDPRSSRTSERPLRGPQRAAPVDPGPRRPRPAPTVSRSPARRQRRPPPPTTVEWSTRLTLPSTPSLRTWSPICVQCTRDASIV